MTKESRFGVRNGVPRVTQAYADLRKPNPKAEDYPSGFVVVKHDDAEYKMTSPEILSAHGPQFTRRLLSEGVIVVTYIKAGRLAEIELSYDIRPINSVIRACVEAGFTLGLHPDRDYHLRLLEIPFVAWTDGVEWHAYHGWPYAAYRAYDSRSSIRGNRAWHPVDVMHNGTKIASDSVYQHAILTHHELFGKLFEAYKYPR